MAIDGLVDYQLGNSGTTTVNLSALTFQADDLLLLTGTLQYTTGSGSFSTPSGWTQLHNWTDTGTDDYAGAAWYRWADGTETTVTAPYSGSPTRVSVGATSWRGLWAGAAPSTAQTSSTITTPGAFTYTPTTPSVAADDYLIAVTSTSDLATGGGIPIAITGWEGRRYGGTNIGFHEQAGPTSGALGSPASAYTFSANYSYHYATTMCAFGADLGGDFITHKFLDP